VGGVFVVRVVRHSAWRDELQLKIWDMVRMKKRMTLAPGHSANVFWYFASRRGLTTLLQSSELCRGSTPAVPSFCHRPMKSR